MSPGAWLNAMRPGTKQTQRRIKANTSGIRFPENPAQDFWRQARRNYRQRRERGLMPRDQANDDSNAAWRQKDASGGL